MDPPAAATTTSATVATPKAQSKPPLSCTSCRARKLKCDRQHPCRNCVRSGLPECIFPERKRSRRPRKSKNSELLERLHRLESIVGKVRLQNFGRDGSLPLQLDAGATTDAAQSSYTAASDQLDNRVKQTEKEAITTTTTTAATPRTQHPLPYEGTASSSPPGIIPGSESQGQGARPHNSTASRYLSGDFWASLCEEVGGLRQALEQSVDSDADEDDGSFEDGTTPESTSTAKSPSYTPLTAMLLGGSAGGAAHAPLRHPPPEHIRFLTATYFQNVDMLLKILHRPSISAALYAFAGQLERQPSQTHHLLSPEREALFFAIYYAAVTSLPASECAAHLGGASSRGELAHSYRMGLERALARADYLNSSSLETLQALTLYTACLRSHDGSRSSWALLSLPVRLAQALDLHRDGDGEGRRLTPFEAEQRRRLWWQLIVLDIRAAEDRGTRTIIARDSYDTRLPHNVDDADFGPETAEPLARLEKPPGAPSDVTFSLCTAESSGIFLYFEHAQNIVDVPSAAPLSSSSAFAAGRGAGAGGEGNSSGSSSRGGGGGSSNDYMTDEATVVRLAQHLEAKFVHGADPSHAASYLASVTVRLIILKLWLVMRYPLHRRPPRPMACSSMPKPHPHPAAPTTVSIISPSTTTSPPPLAAAMMLSHESTLRTAITIMELSERGRSGPFGENFRWWSELYVQWHPLAVALAELCTLHQQQQQQQQQQIDSHQQLLQQRQQRQLTDKAWTVIDVVFPKWSEVIADTKRGTLWRPIRALYRKAREARRAAEGGGMEGQDVHASSNTTEEILSREQGQQQIPRPSDLDRDADTDIRMDIGMGAGIGEANLGLVITGSTTGGYDGGVVAGDSNIPPDLGNLSLDMQMNSMSEEWLAWPDISFEMPPSDSTNWGYMDWSTWDQFVLDTHADHQSKSSSSEPT
ncbi:fungal-specific transcription factor domain-containing protein [Biscogniauxia mediterranea]|nr:fungal-specific transcription factor domain-containing protein [Biscogniauxia mediterranea]